MAEIAAADPECAPGMQAHADSEPTIAGTGALDLQGTLERSPRSTESK